MDLISLKKSVLQMLTEKTPEFFIYHSVNHTLDVLQAVENLIPHFELNTETAQLIQTAALMHETGMTTEAKKHEPASVAIAYKLLPDFGFSIKQIDQIGEMILATAMPQNPQSLEAQILCDADLDYLGREDYFIISHKLRLEWMKTEDYTTDLTTWYHFQRQFLSEHTYFTAAARSLRQQGKKQNLRLIEQLIQQTASSKSSKK